MSRYVVRELVLGVCMLCGGLLHCWITDAVVPVYNGPAGEV